jgi:flagellar biosynthesis protein FlhF
MNECLNNVKAELGPSAVILATRVVEHRRLLGLLRREQVEVTAGRNIKTMRRPRPGRSPRPSLPPGPKTLLETPAAAAGAYLGVQREVGDLRKVVADLVTQVQNDRTPDLPDRVAPHYRTLTHAGVSDALARQVAVAADATLDADVDEHAVKHAIHKEVAARLPVAKVEPRRRNAGRPHVIALVGPTGVGKTTTIAKLAANLKLREGARVALITIDTYRIAAIDQLKKYAKIIDAPLAVVSDAREMKDALARVADHDVVLVDTAGRSPRDAAKLAELKTFLKACQPDETHLVLSTCCGRDSMRLALRRFRGVDADRLTFTKLDEAEGAGAMLDLAAESKLPISYVTAGQDVPHDIAVACSRKLADAVLAERDEEPNVEPAAMTLPPKPVAMVA